MVLFDIIGFVFVVGDGICVGLGWYIGDMEYYDIVVIGLGLGNMILDEDFVDWCVVIIDFGVFGGICFNVGCIFMKMFVFLVDFVFLLFEVVWVGVDL